MNAAEMVPLLERWKAAHDAISEADGDLVQLTGRSPESPLFNAMWGAFGAYTEFLELHLVGRAGSRWLEWYQFECAMGERVKQASVGGKPYRLVRNLTDLAILLMDARPHDPSA
jgi:hypothetical protein